MGKILQNNQKKNSVRAGNRSKGVAKHKYNSSLLTKLARDILAFNHSRSKAHLQS